MNLCRCENGHFYDREKYASCPHCANGLSTDDSVTEFYSEDAGAGAAAAVSPIAPPPMPSPMPVPVMPMQPIDATVPLMPENDVTENLFDTPEQRGQTNVPAEDEDDDHTMAFMDDLFSEVAGNVSGKGASAAVSTGAEKKKTGVSAPCVGWLIAINGTHIGEDFRLVTGRNFIGRGEDMDIALVGDKSVSRSRHAIVVYEPKKHLYLVQPGDSSSLVYHNDEVVLTPVPIKPYDKITVGDVDLVFMSLCNDSFNWNTILSSMKNN